MKSIIDKKADLPENLLESCRKMPYPKTLLMCPPDYFSVIDVKNPHMAGNVGKTDTTAARKQWDGVRKAFIASGAKVELIKPDPQCEDMVFCANQTFVGLDREGDKLCILSQMKHPSRQREVPSFEDWFSDREYLVEALPTQVGFEGSGDAIWHPGRALIWGGYGFRSEPRAYEYITKSFSAPVIRLALKSDRFYHLDTCFCPLTEDTVLIHARSFEPQGLELIRSVFKNVIECDDHEANEGMACNATAIGGKHVVIQSGNKHVVAALKKHGFTVHEVDTSEYLKSGGSVFCMKMYVF